MRKSSSLQFHIELTDSDEVLKSAARHKHQLPPATAIAALSEPLDTSEESLAAQVWLGVGARPGIRAAYTTCVCGWVLLIPAWDCLVGANAVFACNAGL
jgi:hypothetical protein